MNLDTRDLNTIFLAIEELSGAYHRLLLLVGPNPKKTSETLTALAGRLDRPVINLNAELSAALLDVPQRQRPLKAHKLVGDIIDGGPNDILLFDHIDILFAPSLRLDALALLKGLARNKSVVATWQGTAMAGRLRHADERHPEYQNQAVEDITIIAVD